MYKALSMGTAQSYAGVVMENLKKGIRDELAAKPDFP